MPNTEQIKYIQENRENIIRKLVELDCEADNDQDTLRNILRKGCKGLDNMSAEEIYDEMMSTVESWDEALDLF